MKRKSIALLAITVALALFALPSMAFAAGGNGTGGGTGGGNGGGTGAADGSGSAGGQAVPTLVSSVPADQATVSAADAAKLCLVFSNNVTEADLLDNNFAKVHLETADGATVQAIVSTVDTQVEPDKRQNIYLEPLETLAAGDYVIVAEAGIMAKNGNSTEEEYRVAFTVSEESGASSASASSAAASSASSSSASSGAAASSEPSTDNSSQGISPVTIVVIVVIVIAVIAAVAAFRRKSAPADNVKSEADVPESGEGKSE